MMTMLSQIGSISKAGIIMMLVLGSLISSTGHATANNNLDVVLVMDSSGSMKQSDPQELRKPAAKLLISLLQENDRVSVVSFSDQGYPVIYLTPVADNKNQQRLFQAVDKISSKGVYTNLHDAVAKAMHVLKKASQPERRRIILLMSDGKMDMGDTAQSSAMTDKLINDLLPQVKEQQIEIQTIAFTDLSDKGLLSKIAKESGGKFNMAQSDKDLHDVFSMIFEHNKAPDMLPFDGEQFVIDKAIQEVTIVGSKDNAEVILSLLQPDGTRITAEDKPREIKWLVTPQFDLITISEPQNGEWALKASSGKNRAYVITDLKLQLGITPDTPAVGKTLHTRAWLEQKDARLTMKDVLSTVSMSYRVLMPDGESVVLELQPAGRGEDLSDYGVYLGDMEPKKPGHYQINVTAVSGTFAREKTLSIDVDESEISLPVLLPDKAEIKQTEEYKSKKGDSKKKEDKASTDKKNAQREETTEGGKGIIVGIALFVGFNVIVVGIIFGIILYRRKQKKKSANEKDDGNE